MVDSIPPYENAPHVPGTLKRPGWITKYSEVKNQFRSGDIILVHGRYPFSWVIEYLQGSDYGHSAMVIEKKDLDPLNRYNLPGELFLWESNTEIVGSTPNLWRTANPTVKAGPMLIDLEERLKYSQRNYKDVHIAHRPLIADRTKFNFSELLPAFFDSVIDKKFPSDEEIISSAYLGRKYNRSSNDPLLNISLVIGKDFLTEQLTVFENPLRNNFSKLISGVQVKKEKIYCSELLAATYKQLGLLTTTYVDNAYAPVDFSDNGAVRLLQGASFGKEMFVDMLK